MDFATLTLPSSVGVDRDGPLGGVQAGFNLQLGRFVAGIEADASWIEARARTTRGARDVAAFPGAMAYSTFRSELDGLATLRVRAGLAFGRTLIYASGGLALGDVKTGFGMDIPGRYAKSWSRRDAEWGWAAGAGVEYGLTEAVSVKLEYLRYDLGDRTIRYADPALQGEYVAYNFTNEGNSVRAGVNVRF